MAQVGSFTTLDVPGAKATDARPINNTGDITGTYTDAAGKQRGFLLSAGKFIPLEFPGAQATRAERVNDRGEVTGNYTNANSRSHGYLWRQGSFTVIDVPGFDNTIPWGINNRGDVVGMYFNSFGDTKHRGFLWSGGKFTLFDYPLPNTMSCGSDISDDGDIIGHLGEGGKTYTQLIRKGRFSPHEVPGVTRYTAWDGFAGMDSRGEKIVAPYTDAAGKQQGYVFARGRFTTFEVPGARFTRPLGINVAGDIVGWYQDEQGRDHGFLTRLLPAPQTRTLLVDDDGEQCPGALRTIQEAVAQAPAGATILVCPGVYRGTVHIAGPEKTGLKLIASGHEGEVVLRGDYTERDGFHLETVTNALLRGFIVQDFGNKPTTATEWGVGNQIHLQNAHYNTIEHNQLINGDMMRILLVDSGHNTVANNTAMANGANLANCGIHVQGAKSANNVFRLNMTYGNNVAGIMIRGAGPGNRVQDNTVLANGRFGIDVQNTDEVCIEGNRVSYNRGFWGTTPGGQQPGLGINLVNVNKATVFDNRLRNNTGGDLSWDGNGDNKLEANACDTSTPAGACAK